MGKLILVIGKTGSGKSSAIKRLFPPGPDTYVYDVQDEYTGYQSIYSEDVEQAISDCRDLENADIIFEEASIFFNARSSASQALRRLVIGKRHRNQNILFVFHRITAIPADIMGMADIIILYATLDPPDLVKTKFKGFPELMRAFEQVRKKPKYSYATINRN